MHASWNLVSTAYAMAAVDGFVTGVLIVIVIAVLAIDRRTLFPARADAAPAGTA